MNGVHDLGGMQDMGPIEHEANEPVFHARWEGRVYAMNATLGAWRKWSLDTSRWVKEQFAPADYFRMSYYERWYYGLVKLLVDSKLVTRAEIESGKPAKGSPKLTVPPPTEGGAQRRDRIGTPPRFQVGQRVRARNFHPVGHTRLPRYARGRAGTIAKDYGVFTLPDTNATLQGENPQHVYSVRFEARELWGEQANPQDEVYIDMWDTYLEPL
jgi:nitrile hydratase subunit beta